jgi:hypothetical protein
MPPRVRGFYEEENQALAADFQVRVVRAVAMCDGRWVRVSERVASAAIAIGLLGAAVPAQGSTADAGSATPGTLPGGVPGEVIERARQEVIDDAFQPELPRFPGAGSGVLRKPQRKAGGELGDAERERRAILDTRAHDSQGPLSSLMTLLMWGLVAVIAVLVASWLVSELAAKGDEAGPALDDEPRGRVRAVRAAILERPLGDADELARRGDFAEAIHTLLLRTLQELARSAAVRVAPATTSREVLARMPLDDEPRAALAGLITAVEITHFGDEPANAADYERCRQQFHVFAAAFRGNVGAAGAQA